mgnify:CR=1 FL=1
MPTAKRISKEAIIDAAAAVLRTGGFEAINARSVAKALGCSTQPIYLSFRNMEELKSALTQRAIEQHTQRVRESLRAHEGCDSRYSSYGMGFVQFAAQEKQLFRWLYLEDNQPGRHQEDVLEPEIIRAGIQAVDKGQMEGARSCGMTNAQAMRYVVMPQAVKNILPAIGNEFVTMVKETSIIQYLGIGDLMYNNGIVVTSTYNPLPCYYISAIIYLALNIILGKGLNIFEGRLRKSER